MQAAVSKVADRHEIVEALKDPKDRCMYGVWVNVLDLLLRNFMPGLVVETPQYTDHCVALVRLLDPNTCKTCGLCARTCCCSLKGVTCILSHLSGAR